MRVTRTHIAQSLSPGTQLELPEAAANHLLRVLRLKPGDALVLFNGDGFDYHARIIHAERRCTTVAVGERMAARAESPLRIVLAQGIARGEKMDWVLQKATELGVHGIVPIRTEWTEVRLDAERAERRHQHWQGVIAAACEQSGRACVPALTVAHELGTWAASLPAGSLRLALDPDGEQSLHQCPRPEPEQNVVLVVGPEGGLSGRDLATLRAAGFCGLRLGPRVLRTETAGLAALAALQALWGDLGR